ncbi:MAG: FAD-dependent oxidoreductase [Gammaproteobacteria bacterium]|nr:FAD-dependent oxidoreductase [Gammaproteobacteria bacterium]
MSRLFPHLFTPLTLRHKTLKHRLNFGAHTANMAEQGLPGARHLGYYRERAAGGAAMIVVEPVPAHATAVLTRGNFRHQDDAIVPAFRLITEACHEHGAVMIQQIYHVGQHGDAQLSFRPNWSPSGLPSYHDADGSHAMSEGEIEELVDAHVAAAARARDAGFDGVEFMAAYHALIEQFWTPWSNRRDDRWGGSLENRARFSREILARIRAALGDDFIVGVAVSHDAGAEVTLSVEALAEVLAWHDERALVDYVSCGTGSYFDFTRIIPSSLDADVSGVDLARALKRELSHARVQAESHVRTPANAERVVAAGDADMVSIVRGQIADPHMARKAMEDRPEDVRPCISCNQMCWGRRSRDYWISCLVNPGAGRELEWGGERYPPAANPRHVLVVGGGPAGLEAARVAAERGHHVTLVEAAGTLGGQFRLAGLQPSRQQILDNIAWYETRLERLQVAVHLARSADADTVRQAAADEVVIATGATPARTGFQRALPAVDCLPGVDGPDVHTVHEVLAGEARPGASVLVLDDLNGWHAIGTAVMLAEAGRRVTLLTAAPVAAAELAHSAADGPLRKRFARAGGAVLTSAVVLAWRSGSAHLRSLLDGREWHAEFDSLVLATVCQPRTRLLADLEGAGIRAHAIGDCVAPRRASNAVYEGRRLALAL